MAASLAASIVDFILDLAQAPTDQDPNNRVSLEGLSFGYRSDGAIEIRTRRFEVASLRIASGPVMLEVGQLALHGLMALVRMDAGRPRLCALEAASAELSAVKAHAPWTHARQPEGNLHASHAQGSASVPGNSTAGAAAASPWCLGPLAGADGTIRAEIVDAHLLFDADVTVPIRQGRIDLNDATVEHVGPDSRMGVSRLGLYVDAPNGRSYLYQFSSALVCGVEYEQRGALLGPWVTSRGRLALQAFGEGLLRQAPVGHGFTEQARLLFDRTAVSGDVQLGDGKFAAPGAQADFVGRAEGRNLVRLHSEAVGRGLTVDMASLSVRNAAWSLSDTLFRCDELTGAVMLRVSVDGAQSRFVFELANMKVSGLRLELQRPQTS